MILEEILLMFILHYYLYIWIDGFICFVSEIINNNEPVTGCTIHHVTEESDKGDVIIQRQIVNFSKDINILKSQVQKLEQGLIVDVKMWINKPLNYKVALMLEKGNKWKTQKRYI